MFDYITTSGECHSNTRLETLNLRVNGHTDDVGNCRLAWEGLVESNVNLHWTLQLSG